MVIAGRGLLRINRHRAFRYAFEDSTERSGAARRKRGLSASRREAILLNAQVRSVATGASTGSLTPIVGAFSS